MLLILSFAKDLGRSKTMRVYFVLPAPDVIAAILMSDRREALSGAAGGLTRPVPDGSVRLAVWEKNKEKADRGKSA